MITFISDSTLCYFL